MTKEERRARDRVLAQYAYDLDEVVEGADGEVEFLYTGGKDDGPKGDGADRMYWAIPATLKVFANLNHFSTCSPSWSEPKRGIGQRSGAG